ncbi:hypothetical protein EDB89DRAFT_2082581 [Lactarius sanguifluus]|nr:hypothetical protein EDB89DRAFT_2082581 [Lactarius sanguifluus]
MPMLDDQLYDPFKLDLSAGRSSCPTLAYPLTSAPPPPVATLAFLIWDILITLDQEVEAIWTALLFVGTQIAFSLHYANSDCIKWYIFQEVDTQALIAAVEFILIVGSSRWITTSILLLLFIAENIVMIITLVRVVLEIGFDSYTLHQGSFCLHTMITLFTPRTVLTPP